MLQQTGQPIQCYAQMLAGKNGKNGLAVRVDVWRDTTQIVTAASATGISYGVYRYEVSGSLTTIAGAYLVVFSTTDTSVNQQEFAMLWIVGQPWIGHVDADISSRLASSAYTAPPSAAAIDTELTANHGAGSWQPGAAAPSVADIDAALTLAHGTGSWQTGSSGGGATAAEIWSYGARTLTTPAAATPATVEGMLILWRRGDDCTATLTGLGNLTGADQVWFTAKRRPGTQADRESVIQITLTDGLVYLNGADATDAAAGTITIDDAATGTITISLSAAGSAQLAKDECQYDIQISLAGGITTVTPAGTLLNIIVDVTRAIS